MSDFPPIFYIATVVVVMILGFTWCLCRASEDWYVEDEDEVWTSLFTFPKGRGR